MVKLSKAKLNALFAELNKQAAASVKVDIFQSTFPEQMSFIQDKSKLKAALCTRRAAKSYSAGLDLISTCLADPDINCLYIGKSWKSAKRIMYKNVLKAINNKYKLNMKFNETTLDVTFPNGSMLYLAFIDSGQDAIDNLLGGKYKKIYIDEAQSYNTDLKDLIYYILKPTTIDYKGSQIIMTGTPSNNVNSLFYRVTSNNALPDEQGWSLHQWNASSNTFIKEQWDAEIAEQMLIPDIDLVPRFRQQYLGEWVIDLSKLCYKFDRKKNLYNVLPPSDFYTNTLSIDLGFNDSTAFTVSSFSPYDPTLYIRETFKQAGMTIDAIEAKINWYRTRFTFSKIIVDGQSKQLVESMKQRMGLPLTPVKKFGKADMIELCNGDLLTGKIKINEEDCECLIEEIETLVWDEKMFNATNGATRQELASCKNDSCDSFLYNVLTSHNFLAKDLPKEEPDRGSPEWYQKWVKRCEVEAKQPKGKWWDKYKKHTI